MSLAAWPVTHRPLDILKFQFGDVNDDKRSSVGEPSNDQRPQQQQQQRAVPTPTPSHPSSRLSLRPSTSLSMQELLDEDLKAVGRCTPSFKNRLQKVAPLPAPNSIFSGEQLQPSSSTYQDTYPTDRVDTHRVSAAGKRLPRDPQDGRSTVATETSLHRASYPAHSSADYRLRSQRVMEQQDAVQKRLEDAQRLAAKQQHGAVVTMSSTASATSHSAHAPRIQSLQRDSYGAPHGIKGPPERRNPELVQSKVLLREKQEAGYYCMEQTSTHRGDFSVVPQLQKTGGVRAGPTRNEGSSNTSAAPLFTASLAPFRSSSSLGGVAPNSSVSPILAKQGTVLEGKHMINGSMLSKQLQAMSVELADPCSYRSQSSCEVIPQRGGIFPGSAVHVPRANILGPSAINRRAASIEQYHGVPAGFTRTLPNAPRTTMHTSSGIFDAPASLRATPSSLSRASYQPFRFDDVT